MVWISISAIGIISAEWLLKHEKTLEALLLFFEKTELEISHYSLSFPALIEEASKESSTRMLIFIPLCADKIKAGIDFPKAWRQSIEQKPLPLLKKEKEMLLDFGTLFSSCDKEGVIKMLGFYKKSFEVSLNAAMGARKKYAKLCVFSGLFVGGIIFITLI